MKPATASDHTIPASFLDSLLAQAPETLPILRQSCIQVLNLTQDKRSNASDIGEIIMRDQAMMANVIKIANSPAYLTRTPVKTPTYAVALIGFDVIRAMVVSAQLIEQADTFGADTTNLKHLLARALVAGTQAQELGKAINYAETGSLFTNGMLYSLGDLILALCRPDVAEQLEVIRREDPAKIPKAELTLLGRPLQVIASAMARHWNLPDSLVQLLEKKPVWAKSRPEADQRIMESIVRAANELSYCLLNPLASGQEEVLQGLIEQFLPPFGLSMIQLEHTVAKAFRQASEIASAIHIDRQHFLPASDARGTFPHNQHLLHLTQTIYHAIHPEGPSPAELVESAQQGVSSLHSSPPCDRPLLDFAIQVMKISEPSSVLTLAARTLFASCGFERVWLALVVPGKDKLEAKIGYGGDSEAIQATFHCPIKKGNFWDRLIHQFQPIRFSSLVEEEGAEGGIPSDFLQYWGEQPGFAGTLYIPRKPIGLFLVDRGFKGKPLTETDFATFAMVLSQTNANLARLTPHP